MEMPNALTASIPHVDIREALPTNWFDARKKRRIEIQKWKKMKNEKWKKKEKKRKRRED